MEYAGTAVNGLLTIIVYVVVLFGLYKVFQIAADIREIKDIVVKGRSVPPGAAPFGSVGAAGLTPDLTKDLTAEDSAAAYAEQLLRAVNAESQRSENAANEVR